jgi:hypothetical protein
VGLITINRKFHTSMFMSQRANKSNFTFYLSILLFGFIASGLYAQAPGSEEQLKAEDLPEMIRAQIIDTTQIALSPRARFSDAAEPQIRHVLALYAKERRWNLPPIITPGKVAKAEAAPPQNYTLHLSAYPSLPDSLFYNVLFGGHVDETRGYLRLDRKQLGDERTKGRGDYNVDGVRAGFGYQYQPLSELSADVGLYLKDLGWLASTQGASNFQKELLLFGSDLSWKQQLSETSHSTLSLDAEIFRLTHPGNGTPKSTDEGADLRVNFDMSVPLPFQNPFHIGKQVDVNPAHLGGTVEYFSATDARSARDIWATIFRVYIRDSFTIFGPFVLGTGAEGVSFRERDDAGADKTRLQFNPYLAVTTEFGPRWTLHLKGQRETSRAKLSDLYFDSDYISLNPFLRPEKSWSGWGTLKYHQGRRIEVNFSGFAKELQDLVILEKLDTTTPELTWSPTNLDALIYGGQLDISFHIADGLDGHLQFTHEFHEPDVGTQLAYRPEDTLNLSVAYDIPRAFRMQLGSEFQGRRHVDATTDQTLDSYLLLKPKLSRTFAEHVDVFVSGAFAIGEYALLDGYELSPNHVDFGVELRF